MTLLIAGLVVFFGIHVLPWWRSARDALSRRFGERAYKASFALVALVGFVLIVLGKARAPVVPLYDPPAWGRSVAPLLVLLGFLVLPGAYIRSNIKRYTRHPMLWGVTLWALAHLLANGDRASVWLFGVFLVYSLADMAVANAHGARLATARQPRTQDAKVLVAGAVAYIVFLLLHPYLFGVRVL